MNSSQTDRKIGLFGGSFDPVHQAHLIIAEMVRSQFELEKIIWMPAQISPLKTQSQPIDAEHRLNMIRLAIAGNPQFTISEIELKRSGISYTVDTILEIKQNNPDYELYLMIGEDQARLLPEWKRIHTILEQSKLIICNRPLSDEMSGSNLVERFDSKYANQFLSCSVPSIDLSSSLIRSKVKEGKSIRYLVPAAVEQYIMHHKLYS